MAQLPSHLPEIHHQHMAPHKLKPARAMVPLLLRLTEHPLVTVPPPQKLDPVEPTLELELPALMEDTKNPPLQRHYLQLQRGARHSMADTPAPLLSQHLLSYRRGKTNFNSIKRQHSFIVKSGGSVARTALTVVAGMPQGKGTTRIAL